MPSPGDIVLLRVDTDPDISRPLLVLDCGAEGWVAGLAFFLGSADNYLPWVQDNVRPLPSDQDHLRLLSVREGHEVGQWRHKVIDLPTPALEAAPRDPLADVYTDPSPQQPLPYEPDPSQLPTLPPKEPE